MIGKMLAGGLLVVASMSSAFAAETNYVCEHGIHFSVEYGGSSAGRALATLHIDGRSDVLQRMASASGARYGNAATILSIKGRQAMLEQRGMPPIRGCIEQRLATLPQAVSAPLATAAGPQVSGTLTYRERIALPTEAIVVIQVQDVSRADTPATLLAEKRIATQGAQVPIPFVMDVAPELLRPDNRVTITARIYSGERLLFVSAVAVPVLTQGHGAQVMLMMKRADDTAR